MSRRSQLILAIAMTGLVIANGAAFAGTSTCSPTLFARAASYAAGNGPEDVAVGDLNEDGSPDLAVADGGFTPGLSVLINDGHGGFQSPLSTASQFEARRIALATLDPDSHLDVVVGGLFNVEVYRGNGDGTFQPVVTYPGITAPNALVIADVNHDGIPDIVEGGQFAVDVYLGNGDGTFGDPIVTTSANYVLAMDVGNLDAGSSPDLVIATESNNLVQIYSGNGDGTFDSPTELPVDSDVQAVAIFDMDGDGKPDILASTLHEVAVALGNGDGTFQAAVLSPSPFPGGPGLITGDLDGDGIADAALTSGLSYGETFAFKGLGDGRMSFLHAYESGAGSFGLASGDMDGDGRPDLIATDAYRSAVSELVNLAGGRFLGIEKVPLGGGLATSAAGDFDGDGIVDLAALGSDAGNGVVVMLIGDGLGSFSTLDPGTPVDSLANWIAAGDFDGDGKLDLVVTTYFGQSLYVLMGNGDGTFAQPVVQMLSYEFRKVVVADLNGDEKLDLALIADDPSSGNQGTFLVMLGNGDGSFQSPSPHPLPNVPADLAVADLTGEGVLDAVVAEQAASGTGGVSVLLGAGDGTFGQPVQHSAGLQPSGVAVGDFDQDGHPDLAVANGGAQNISILPGDGQGGFGDGTLIAVGSVPYFIVVADLSHDGIQDVATASYTGGTVAVLRGIGNGRFQSPEVYDAQPTSGALAAVDLRGSGDLDLTAAGGSDGTIFVLLNTHLSARVSVPSVFVGQPAILRAMAAGSGPVAYQWRKNGTALADGGTVSGSQTAALTIDPVSFADAGSYDVVVTDSCTSATSNAAALSVEFADVPTSSPFHDDILTIATAGITGGCGGGNYCPTSPVRRDQMAVFLLKSEHGSSYLPPPCTGVFPDVPCPSSFADWVEQLATEGVTGGCGAGNYCPDASVTRAQMAVFLLKTSQGSSYTPPPATGIFGDVPAGSFAADFIEDLYNRGITGGCQLSPLLYCPGNTALRQQMATFLVRTFLGP